MFTSGMSQTTNFDKSFTSLMHFPKIFCFFFLIITTLSACKSGHFDNTGKYLG
jgi:hypothetical protein